MGCNYDKNNPFFASIVERYCLNSKSSKKTYHLVLDLSKSNIEYKVGDSLAIFPSNNSLLIERLLNLLHLQGSEQIVNKKGEALTIAKFLKEKANLSKLPKKLVQLAFERLSSEEKRTLQELLDLKNKDSLNSYLEENSIEDFFLEYPSFKVTPQELCDLCYPLLPRFYSIASSMNIVGSQAHLTIGLNEYLVKNQLRKGVCSQFLCEEASLMQPIIPTYLHPSDSFTLPVDSKDKPIIMVGPGTGIAPFRGFMQERIFQKASSRNWLFFGERHQKSDFYYSEFWTELSSNGQMKVDTAFSRDQEHKIYVQDKILEKSREIWQWLQEGAYLFVCGDAKKMAKDVDNALQNIVEREGKKSSEDARQYLKNLRSEKRYLRDVY